MGKNLQAGNTSFYIQMNNKSSFSDNTYDYEFCMILKMPQEYVLADILEVIKFFGDYGDLGEISFFNEYEKEKNFSCNGYDEKLEKILFQDFKGVTPEIGIIVCGKYFNIGTRGSVKTTKVYPELHFPSFTGKISHNNFPQKNKKFLQTLSDFLKNDAKQKAKETYSESEIFEKMEKIKNFFKNKYRISQKTNKKGNYYLEKIS